MDIWDTIEKVEIKGSRDKFEVGTHTCKILELKVKPSTNPAKPGYVYLVADFEVLSSYTHAPGDHRSAVFEVFPDQYKYGRGEVKGLVCAALGLTPNQVDKRVMDNATSPAQSLAGRTVIVRGYTGQSKKGEFTKLEFSAAEDQEAPEAPPAPVEAAPFPPPGWTQNPKAPAYYYRRGADGKVEQLTEAALRAL